MIVAVSNFGNLTHRDSVIKRLLGSLERACCIKSRFGFFHFFLSVRMGLSWVDLVLAYAHVSVFVVDIS